MYKVNEMNDLCGILLFLMLLGLPFGASVNLECRKHFICANTTYFNICVDYGDGKLMAIEDLIYPCPPGFVCEETNMHECQLPSVTTTILPSSTTTSLTDKRSTILNILGTISVTTTLPTQTNDNSDEVNATMLSKYGFTTEDNKIINDNTTKDYATSTYLTTEKTFPMTSNFTIGANLKNSTISNNTNSVKMIIETEPVVQSNALIKDVFTKIASNSLDNIPANYSIIASAISDRNISEKDLHMKKLSEIEPFEQLFNSSNINITILNKTMNNHTMKSTSNTTVLAYEKYDFKTNDTSEKNGNTVNNDIFSSIKNIIVPGNVEPQSTQSPNMYRTTEMGISFLVDIPLKASINQTKDVPFIVIRDHNTNITHNFKTASSDEKLEENNMTDIFFMHISTETSNTEKSTVFFDTTTEYITIVPATIQTETLTIKNNFTQTNYLSPEIKKNVDRISEEYAEVIRDSTVRMWTVMKTKMDKATATKINITYETTTETVINTSPSSIEQTMNMSIFEDKNNDIKSNLNKSIEQIITIDNLTLTEFDHSLNYQMNKNISNPINISTTHSSSVMIQNTHVINNNTTNEYTGNITIKEKETRPTEETMMYTPLVVTETTVATPSIIYDISKKSNNKSDNDPITKTNSVIFTIDSSAAKSNLSTEQAEVLVRNSSVLMTSVINTKVNEDTSANINSTYVMSTQTGVLLTNSSSEQIMSIIDLLKDKKSAFMKDSAKDTHNNITKSYTEINTIKESNSFSSSIELIDAPDSLKEIKSDRSSSHQLIKNISNPITISTTDFPNGKDEKYYKFLQNFITYNTTTALEKKKTIKDEQLLSTDAKTFKPSVSTGIINIILSTKYNTSKENNNELNQNLMETSNSDTESIDLSTEIPIRINNINRLNTKIFIPEKNTNISYQLEHNTEKITVNEDLLLSTKNIKVFNNISEHWTSINKSDTGEVQRSTSTDTTAKITAITITSPVEQTTIVNSSIENINNIATEINSVIINSDITDKYYEPRDVSNKIATLKTIATEYYYSRPKPEIKTATEHNAGSTFIEEISAPNNAAQAIKKVNVSVNFEINQNEAQTIYNLTTTTEGIVTYIHSVNTGTISKMYNLNKLNNNLMTTTNTEIIPSFPSIEITTITNIQAVMMNNVNENTEYRSSNNVPKLTHNLTSKLENTVERTNANEDFPSSTEHTTVSNIFTKYKNRTLINKFNVGKIETNTTSVSTIETITGIINSDTEPKKTMNSFVENENPTVEKILSIKGNNFDSSQRKNTENNFKEIADGLPTHDMKFNFSDGVTNQSSNIFEMSTQNVSVGTPVDQIIVINNTYHGVQHLTQKKLKLSEINKPTYTEMTSLGMNYDDFVQNENDTVFKDLTNKDKQQSNEFINWMNISKETTPKISVIVTPAAIFNVKENSMNKSNTYLMTTDTGLIDFSTETPETTTDDTVNLEFSNMQMGLIIKEIEEKSAKIQNTSIIKISNGTFYTIIDKKPYNGRQNNISQETESSISNLDTTMTTLDIGEVKTKTDTIKNKLDIGSQPIRNFTKINHDTTLKMLTTKMPSLLTTEKINISPTELHAAANNNNSTIENKAISGSKTESTKIVVASEDINSTEHKTDNFNTTNDITKVTSLKIITTIVDSPEVLVNINGNTGINKQNKLAPINRRIDDTLINTTKEIEHLGLLLKNVVVSVNSNTSLMNDEKSRTSHINAENSYNTPIITKVEFTAKRQNSDIEIFEKSFNNNYTTAESTTEKLLQKIVVTTNKIPEFHDKTIANETLKMHYHNTNNSHKFDCRQTGPGKYGHNNDCRTFYICDSKQYPVIKKCQEDTVFSDITKQCTQDLSHCVRKNEFQCPNVGRFNDIINDNYYYICVMDKQNKYVKFKFQCRDGFHLNISSVKCVPDDVNSILSPESNDSEIESSESSTKTNDQKINGQQTEGDISMFQNIRNQESSVTFDCRYKNLGQYADSNNCKTYYICTGKRNLLIRKCPEDTVFSELENKCTKNLSHCIRRNEFICTSEGKFIDILKDNYYYICARQNVNHYLRFHLKCEDGFDLDKSSIKCMQKEEKNIQSYSFSELSIITPSEQDNGRSRKQRASKASDFECKEEGKYSDPQNCKKFYECSKKDGRFLKKKKKCKSDKVFHKDKKKCVSASSVDCNSS